MTTDLVVVDAFTDHPFAGNPAAVCLLDGPAEVGWMQQLAAEMNLAETAFLWADPADEGGRSLRWFTPTVEVELCGHATLASAHVLFRDGHVGADETLRFATRSGRLTARLVDDRIELDLPRTEWEPADDAAPIAVALGVDVSTVVATATGHGNHIAELADWRAIEPAAVDIAAVAALPLGTLLVTALGPGGSDGPDAVTRYFAPRYGIDEDPVTGSAHCLVGPWFADRVGATLRCRQASARGGDLLVTVAGDRVLLAGDAVTTLRSTLLA